MDEIRSRFDIPYKEMEPRHVEHMLRSKVANSIIDGIARNFIRHDPRFTFDEIKSVSIEGFWRAIKSYDPKRGSLINHAAKKCNAYIRLYAHVQMGKSIYDMEDMEDEFDDSNSCIEGTEDRLLDKIELDRVLSKISKKNRELLMTHFLTNGQKIRNSSEVFGISRFKLMKQIDIALSEARSKFK